MIKTPEQTGFAAYCKSCSYVEWVFALDKKEAALLFGIQCKGCGRDYSKIWIDQDIDKVVLTKPELEGIQPECQVLGCGHSLKDHFRANFGVCNLCSCVGYTVVHEVEEEKPSVTLGNERSQQALIGLSQKFIEPQFRGFRWGRGEDESVIQFEFFNQGEPQRELLEPAFSMLWRWGSAYTVGDPNIANALLKRTSLYLETTGIILHFLIADATRLNTEVITRLPKWEWILSIDTIIQWLKATHSPGGQCDRVTTRKPAAS